jgi:hypothetical protein
MNAVSFEMTPFALLTFCVPSSVAVAAFPFLRLERSARRVGVTLVLFVLALVTLLFPAEERVLRALLAIVVLFAAAKVFDVMLQRAEPPSFATYLAFVLKVASRAGRRRSSSCRDWPSPRRFG